MKVNGREVKFKRTILATCTVAGRCKDGDIKNIGLIFNGSTEKMLIEGAHFIAALSNGYEQFMKYSDPTYEPKPVTFEECLSLNEDEFMALFEEAQNEWIGERPTIQTVEVKQKGKKKAKVEASN